MKIVLDMDDTLYLEQDYVRSGFRAVAFWLKAHHGTNDFFDRAWDYFLFGRRNDIFNQVLQDMNIDGNRLIPKLVEVYRNHKPDICLLPDTEVFLNNYTPDQLAVISDGYSESQWAKVRSLDIECRVENIIVTNDWGRKYWKPHPRAFEVVQRDLPADDCVYIADNPLKDFIAPTSLGWKASLRIRREGSLHESVPTPENCIEVQTLDEVIKMLPS